MRIDNLKEEHLMKRHLAMAMMMTCEGLLLTTGCGQSLDGNYTAVGTITTGSGTYSVSGTETITIGQELGLSGTRMHIEQFGAPFFVDCTYDQGYEKPLGSSNSESGIHCMGADGQDYSDGVNDMTISQQSDGSFVVSSGSDGYGWSINYTLTHE
jgi:hypothetical protein